MRTSMISVSGLTYRIDRIRSGVYRAVRLLDDALMGTFWVVPRLRLEVVAGDERTLREIAHAALREAKTSWVGRSPVRTARRTGELVPALPRSAEAGRRSR